MYIFLSNRQHLMMTNVQRIRSSSSYKIQIQKNHILFAMNMLIWEQLNTEVAGYHKSQLIWLPIVNEHNETGKRTVLCYIACHNCQQYDTMRYVSKNWQVGLAVLIYRVSEKWAKNKLMSISPIQFSDPWRQSECTRSVLRWEGFVEKVGFEPGVKEWQSSGC